MLHNSPSLQSPRRHNWDIVASLSSPGLPPYYHTLPPPHITIALTPQLAARRQHEPDMNLKAAANGHLSNGLSARNGASSGVGGWTGDESTSRTVSVLEERLTLTEDKLKECLLNQSQILKDVQSGERSQETDGSPVHFT
ncbi:hypothetical protein KUCAC02_021312 [Chaenocephalus aceratus]|uniref:Uncharacterized protein n=1 Tax=Chaenocephalus aceratus TaxID=36190 RepID=A0ACB9XFQ7_CHAAC|nr:hypothetical protein KUCAC02_021312 [Chaenocephalus aceratus]